MARSKGYGFIEFHDHEDALIGLRVVNNNPTAMQVRDDCRRL